MTLSLTLAAGRGSRLQPYTDEMPKCMLPFAGSTIFEIQAKALQAAGVDTRHVVCGYKEEVFDRHDVTCWRNPLWDRSNMVESLLCARPLMERESELLITYGDIVFEPKIVQRVFDTSGDVVVAIDLNWLALWDIRNENPLDDAESLKMDEDGNILDIGRKVTSVNEIEGQYIGCVLARKPGLEAMMALYDSMETGAAWLDGRTAAQCYMTDFLRGMIATGCEVKAAPFEGGWLEFDTVEDLELYSRLHAQRALKPFFDLEAL